MGFYVRFWGTRGSIPTPGKAAHRYGGNTSCVEIRVDDTLFICDGGSGLRELGTDLLARAKGQPITAHFLFSHMHWDHIQGFPFFTPVYIPANKFFIYGAHTGDTRFHRLLSGQMSSSYFPVDFSELRGTIVAADLGDDGERLIEGTLVRCLSLHHPGGCYAYRFERDGRSVVYATDNEIDQTLPDPDSVIANPAAPREIPADLVKFCEGADVLISDSQYTDDEYPTRIGWGHPRASTAVDLAVQAGVKQLALYHHDPMHSDHDVERKIANCRARVQRLGGDVFIFGAREGLEIRVDVDEPEA